MCDTKHTQAHVDFVAGVEILGIFVHSFLSSIFRKTGVSPAVKSVFGLNSMCVYVFVVQEDAEPRAHPAVRNQPFGEPGV